MDGSNQDIVGFKKVEEFFSFAVQSCKILKSVVDVAVGGARGGGPDGGGVRGGGLSGGGAWGGALGEGCLGGGRGRREIELQEWHNQSGVILRCLMVIKFVQLKWSHLLHLVHSTDVCLRSKFLSQQGQI